MKKVLFIFCFALFLFTAQTASAQAQVNKGDVLLNVGLGFGYYYGEGGTALTGSAEWAINNFFSVGPYMGFSSSKYNAGGYKYTTTFLDLGGRASYHFSEHISNLPKQLDLYGGASLGFVVVNYSEDLGDYDPYGSAIRGSIYGGARWYFTEKFAVNGELNFGYAPLIVGVTFKL